MQRNLFRARYLFILLFSLSVVFYSCKSSEQTADQSSGTTSDSAAPYGESGMNLAAYRNTLGDGYTTMQHDMPKQLMQATRDAQFGNRNPFEGFRIQLASTRSVATADSVAKSFRIWADTTFAGYKPDIHQFFKQPHYRVHVGDFTNRQRANKVSRMVKRKFPNAWVVHDRIDPNLVPADTVNIHLKTLSESKQKN